MAGMWLRDGDTPFQDFLSVFHGVQPEPPVPSLRMSDLLSENLGLEKRLRPINVGLLSTLSDERIICADNLVTMWDGS